MLSKNDALKESSVAVEATGDSFLFTHLTFCS